MASGHELAPERDGREGVSRLPECGQQDPAAGATAAPAGSVAGGQIASASACTIRERPSASGATGVTTIVPTPASR